MSEPTLPPPSSGAVFDATDPAAAERAARAVHSAAEQVESVGAIEPAARGALYAVLSSLADNKYVLGRRYAEWCTGAPMLESAVAAAAMAQDELGHARSFYPLLRGFPEATSAATAEELGWQSRPTSAMACLDAAFAGWHQFVAANFLVDTALTTLLEGATESAYEPLRQRARKILQEEDAHWAHAEGWVRRLADDAALRPGLAGCLAGMWDDAFSWFGHPDDAVLGELTRADLLAAGPDALRERLRARVGPVLDAVGLADDLLRRELPWGRWEPTARRLHADA